MPDPVFSITGGVGVIDLRATEYVYENGDKLSQLNWHSRHALLYTLGLEGTVDADWTLSTQLRLGAEGDGHMIDYDWVDPYARDGGMTGWSDRSISPDTQLDHYVDLSLEAKRRLADRDGLSLSAFGGFRYTDVKWTSYGGGYIYSEDGFRNSVGHFPEGERGISYRQKIPVPYLGLESQASFGGWSLGARAGLGLTFGIEDIDDHWMRNLRFFDSMDAAPVTMLSLSASYAISDRVALTLAGDFENVARRRGDMRLIDTKTGESGSDSNAAGASFRSLSVSVGLKGSF
ncbi:hypothetical protein BTR14_14785 [Rhizobium rhizosphaerae]|uniref:Omptin family outer membrane protease n=1 Tax=Xaviernesmea rhizosphaerae TaxID=1672749 RepID=A0ABX3PCK4_9HYPH|nr:omptin family outer membrane protease [Xaviernesmea rhizosphaerae]OQP85728.1 hypothetical protein BTR14_14785 [Xaviernesmea rhizosphaerae]